MADRPSKFCWPNAHRRFDRIEGGLAFIGCLGFGDFDPQVKPRSLAGDRVRIGPYQEASDVDKIKIDLAEFNFDVTVIKVTNNN